MISSRRDPIRFAIRDSGFVQAARNQVTNPNLERVTPRRQLQHQSLIHGLTRLSIFRVAHSRFVIRVHVQHSGLLLTSPEPGLSHHVQIDSSHSHARLGALADSLKHEHEHEDERFVLETQSDCTMTKWWCTIQTQEIRTSALRRFSA